MRSAGILALHDLSGLSSRRTRISLLDTAILETGIATHEDPVTAFLQVYDAQEPETGRAWRRSGRHIMQAKLVSFGEIQIEGRRYDHDVVIEKGEVRKRRKKSSKAYRARFGHTPLSDRESIPWHGGRLIIGTGAYGNLPVMPEVFEEARQKGIVVIMLPTVEVCSLLEDLKPGDVNAILHVTC